MTLPQYTFRQIEGSLFQRLEGPNVPDGAVITLLEPCGATHRAPDLLCIAPAEHGGAHVAHDVDGVHVWDESGVRGLSHDFRLSVTGRTPARTGYFMPAHHPHEGEVWQARDLSEIRDSALVLRVFWSLDQGWRVTYATRGGNHRSTVEFFMRHYERRAEPSA